MRAPEVARTQICEIVDALTNAVKHANFGNRTTGDMQVDVDDPSAYAYTDCKDAQS